MEMLKEAIFAEEEEFPRSEDGLHVSEEEYWEKYYELSDRVYEWNNGVLEEKTMSDRESFDMYRWYLAVMGEYLKKNPVGDLAGLEIGFRLSIPGNTSVRKPDLALVLKSNSVPFLPDDRSYHGIFDMCIEFLSDADPSGVVRDTVTKKIEYCRTGVKEYFILDRKGKETAFYRLHGLFYTEILPAPGGIIRSAVLPGFQFRIEDLYRRPPLAEMSADPVYKSFVMKEYQEAKEAAEKASREAEKERRRAEKAEREAEKERLRAEKLAARLRELGIADV